MTTHPLDRVRQVAKPGEEDHALRLYLRHDLAAFTVLLAGELLTAPFNRMHREIMARPKAHWRQRAHTRKVVDAAPRGGAKTLIAAWADVLHDIAYDLEAYICMLSTSYDLAEDSVKAVRAVLVNPEDHPHFHHLYGPFRVEGGATDFVVHAPRRAARGLRVKAFSLGGQIRGTKHQGIRPTKVIMDDMDHPTHVRSPLWRETRWAFLTKDVAKVGQRGSTFRMLGTVLHPDSLLARALASPGWHATRWQAVIEWPVRMDLWKECERIWANLRDPDREEAAHRFYLEHRVAMDAGAVVLWPEHESLWELMVQRWSDGIAAFESEKQNNPHDPERQVFDIDSYARCRVEGRRIHAADGRSVSLRECVVGVWLDPAVGQQQGHDYSCVATVARDPDGYRYVIGAQLRKEAPSRQRGRVWAHFERHGPRARYGVENNGFAVLFDEGFHRERQDRQKAGLPHALVVRGYPSTQNKEERISRLEPHAALGWLQFAEDLPGEFWAQMRSFPTAAHDDGPDAVERADWLASSTHMPTITPGHL